MNIFLLGNVERISRHNCGSSRELIGNINNTEKTAGEEASAQHFSTPFHTNRTAHYLQLLHHVHATAENTKFSYEIRRKHAVVQLDEALRYKPEGRGFDSRRGYSNFSMT